MSKITELEQAIVALEQQRGILGDGVVDAALSAMRAELAQLKKQEGGPEHQRKLVTLLFMDVVGSTRLTQGMDPEEVLDIMDGALRLLSAPVEKYNGRVTRFMGDGFKAVFGLPLAQEDDAERAVLAGLEVLEVSRQLSTQFQTERQLPGFRVRVGINSGMVAIGGYSEAEDTVMGLTVNLGARMEQAAPPGGLLISYNTFRFVRDRFEAQPVEPVSAKGFEKPVPAYLVQGLRSQPFSLPTHSVRGQQTRLVGRAAELTQLQEAFRAAVDGGRTQVVTLIGEPGLGKGRLLAEFSRWLKAQAGLAPVFKSRAAHHSTAMPYSLLRSLFTEQFDIHETNSAGEVRQKFEAGLADYLPEETRMKVHFIGALLGLEFSDSPYLAGVQDDAQQLRQRALFYLGEFFRALTQQFPVVIYLDDVHLADAPSLEVIFGLANRHPETRMLIVAAARPELYTHRPDWDEWLAGMDFQYRQVQLEPLTQAQSEALAGEILRAVEDLPDWLVQQVATHSEGNPYYLEELIRVLIDDEVILIPESGTTWRVNPEKLYKLRIPSTLTALLQARLDGLPSQERTLLQQAAVVGRTFWAGVLQTLQPEPERCPFLIRDLIQRELILPKQNAALEIVQEYAFKSPIMQEVVYNTVPLRKRKAYHAAVAAWLVGTMSAAGRVEEYAAIIAHHFEHTDDSLRAAEWYLRAGKRAAVQGAPREALNFVDRAWGYLAEDELDGRWRAVLLRHEVLSVLGETAALQENFQQMMALAQAKGEDEWFARVYYNLGFHAATTGRQAQAITDFDRAMQFARRSQSTGVMAAALALKVVALMHTGQPDQADAAAQQALDVIHEISDVHMQARVLTNLARYYGDKGDIAQAITLAHQAHQIAEQLDERVGVAVNLGNLGYNYLLLGQVVEGRDLLEQAVKAAESIDARYYAASIRLNLGLAYAFSHKAALAERALGQCLEELETIGDRFGTAAAHFYFGLVQEQEMAFAGAEASFRRAWEIHTQIGLLGYARDALAGLARCALAAQDTAQAMQSAGQVWETLDESGGAGMEFPMLAYLTCARVYAAAGDKRRAQQVVGRGCAELRQRAEKISDSQWRACYLMNVPEHHQLLEWEKQTIAVEQEGNR